MRLGTNAVSQELLAPAKEQRPSHVAIIMDGNGRWAMDRNLARLEGHRRGADTVRDIVTFARELEIGYITLYSFSRQNWCRPVDEINGLMHLLEEYCAGERDTLMKHEIRFITIGESMRIPLSTRRALAKLSHETAHNRKMTLCLAVDYDGREELTRAMKSLASDVENKHMSIDCIDESAIKARLDTALLPDPDLLIRTSGEQRISNFLLWQLAYTELHFTQAHWPEFTKGHFLQALHDYAHRDRRFGAVTKPRSVDATTHTRVCSVILG